MSETLRALAPPGLGLGEGALAEVEAAYSGPTRHYHTLDHVHEVARRYAEVAGGPGWREPEAVYLAVLAHDAVYVVGRRDNEARSADLARAWARRWWGRPEWGERAAALVEATAAHHALPAGEDRDLDHFLDCDLAVLGAPDEVYDRYAAGVHAEYAPLAGKGYRPARAAFLAGLLGETAIFRSAFFRARLERAARRNLARELVRLSVAGSDA